LPFEDLLDKKYSSFCYKYLRLSEISSILFVLLVYFIDVTGRFKLQFANQMVKDLKIGKITI